MNKAILSYKYMPELPEVETIKRGLSSLIINRTVDQVVFDNPKSFPNSPSDVKQFLIGAKITQVNRRGKALILTLDNSYALIIHLKMTGQLVYDGPDQHFGAGHPNDSLIRRLPDKTTRVTITFTDGTRLFFNDQRKFGWVRLYPASEICRITFFERLGPEPLDPDFTWQMLKNRLVRRQRSTIKAALLDQSVIAGVGNIYADESLWGAKIHPGTLVEALNAPDYKRLHKALIEILMLAINKGGSTDRNYVNAKGERGNYLEFARVFRREGQTCPRCATVIEKTRIGGRGTHFCPHCQHLKSINRYNKQQQK
ncbi:DNA-formamidopyrimidine glycosylase [Patescibacteria group bacterium]|nr:DNA-formamidopyrimidine glycosylase [Patescibacteria group bacterium]